MSKSTIDISKLILHKKKFLPSKECDNLIQYYELNKDKNGNLKSIVDCKEK